MKPSKSASIAVALLLVAAVGTAASRGGVMQIGADRPPGVAEEDWVAIGKRAGFVVRDNSDARVPAAELHVRTTRGWVHSRLENPVAPILVPR
jgi:hypothetical protein